MINQELIQEFKGYINQSRRIVFLTGAGISTESGIPDFRSADGLYSNPKNINIFDISAFLADPKPFYQFSAEFLEVMENSLPNPAHLAIARLQETHLVTVVTQNIDDLHQRAGSRTVWCVHGNLEFSRCVKCGHRIATQEIYPVIRKGEIPYHSCGGVYKPEVTFFGESLPEEDWLYSQKAIEEADLLCVVGSSLAVYPAAALPGYRSRKCRLVIINREPTPLDTEADLVIHGDAGKILSNPA